MEAYRTEEEQIEAIRKFAEKEGPKILLVIVVAIASFFGFQGWKNNQQASIDEASLYYSELSGLMATGQALSDSDEDKFDKHFTALVENHANSIYASYASLLKAKLEADSGELDVAAQLLQWVIDADANNDLKTLAVMRKSQILFAKNDLDGALALLKGNAGPFVSEYAELRGDILLEKGDNAQALVEYKKAKDAMSGDSVFSGRVLDVKIESIEPGDSSKLFPISASAEESSAADETSEAETASKPASGE